MQHHELNRFLQITAILMVVWQSSLAFGQGGSEESITAIKWNTAGETLFIGTSNNSEAGCSDGKVYVQDSIGNATIVTIEMACGVVDIGISHDGELILAQNAVGETGIWSNTAGYVYLRSLGSGADITTMEASPAEARVARVLFNELVEIVEYEAENPDSTLVDLEPVLGGISDVAWSPGGDRLIASSLDGFIGLWDSASGDVDHIITYEANTGKTTIAWSSEERFVAFGDFSGSVIVWDLDEAGATYHFEEHSDQVNDMAYSPDGTRLASASEDGTVKVWNAQTGALIETLTYPGPVYALDWSPDGSQIAYGGADSSGNPPEVMIVDAPEIEPTPTPTFTEPFDDAITPGEYITALDWDSDGSRLVFGTGQLLLPWPSEEGGAGGSRILVIERGGNLLYEVSVPYSTVAVEIDPTGETLLIFDVIPYLWDLQTGEMILRRNSEGLALQTGTWNPSTGSLLFTPVFGSLVYDAATWENLSYFADFLLPSGRFSEGQRMADSVWSPDGIHVASSTTFGPIYVWDSSNLEGVLEATFTGHSASIQDTVWSPDGTLIASGDVDGNVFVWNAQTGAVVTELDGHTDAILDMDWRPDGQQIITTSLDGTMRAWTWPSGAMNVVQSGTVVSAVAYSPDGMELAYGGLVPPGSLPEIVIVDAPQIEPTPTPTFTEPFDGAISTPEP
ncbi:MAG: hypothetical protein IPK52_09365 [Chloroflexi bacterium]|nr:hypothetical protein [Chloroflexota bacterium]